MLSYREVAVDVNLHGNGDVDLHTGGDSSNMEVNCGSEGDVDLRG